MTRTEDEQSEGRNWSSQRALDVALGAERWIDGHRYETDHGLVWGLADEVPDKHFHNLYSGSAGIALFYLELFSATEDSRFLRNAELAGREIMHKLDSVDALPCALLGGWGGYLFTLAEIARATGKPEMAAAASRCAQRQRDQARSVGAGIGWVQEMPYAKLTGFSGERELYDVAEGAAGAGLAWLYAHENDVHEEALAWTTAAAERLLEVAEPAPGGLRWQLMDDIPWPFDAPNFGHGTAGVAYYLARVYEHTNDLRFLEAAIAGAQHVQAVAKPQEAGGHLVPHILNDGAPDRYYLGICHGPAGTSRLFYLLTELTAEARWREWSDGLDLGLLASGAPEVRSRGLWNNISQCCCDAGIGDHALYRYRIGGDAQALAYAQRVAGELERRAVKDANAYRWPQAEHRSQPDFIQTQTGYMQGAAGVGSFFVHLAGVLGGSAVAKIDFPDTPYARLSRQL